MLSPGLVAPNTLVQNRYLVVRVIGQGGMGAVYEAIDQRLGNIVALKQTLVHGAQLDKAFEREAKILAGLRHGGLPKVMDFFSDAGGQFLVMEFVPGEDLARLLERRGAPFAPDEVLGWTDQVTGTLHYLHTHQPPIIHRDIKPHNLKLTPQGEIVLLDFGLAKGAASAQSQATNLSSVIGYTPLYGPIEQIQGTGTDPRSDLYALAATLYHLMTGMPPIDALTRAAAVLRYQPDPLRPPHVLNPQVPTAVSAVLMQAMALDPARRPASAAALRDALRAARPAAATFSGNVAPTLVVGAGGAADTLAVAPPVSPRPSGRPARFWIAPAIGGAVVLLVILGLLARFAVTSIFSRLPLDQSSATQSTVRSTFTPRPVATNTPRPTATPRPQEPVVAGDLGRAAQVVYGPIDGALNHDDDNFVELSTADAQVRDFIVEAKFYNPYDRSRGRWDYGLFLRNTGTGEQYRLTVDADAQWALTLSHRVNDTTEFTDIASGKVDNLDVSAGGSNDLRVIFNGETAYFYANSQYVATFDVSGKVERGDIAICTGLNDNSEINGESTRFERFTVWSLDADQAFLTQAKQQGRLVARDDFVDNANKWFLGNSSDGNAFRTIRDGVMAVTLKKENWVFWETWEAQFENLVAEVDVTSHTDDAGGGIIFGYQDNHNFLYVRIVDGYFILEKLQNDTWTAILDWAQNPAIRGKGETNKVMVVRKGGAVLIYINGILVGQAQASDFPRGKVGIAASSGKQINADVDLDNMRFWKLP